MENTQTGERQPTYAYKMIHTWRRDGGIDYEWEILPEEVAVGAIEQRLSSADGSTTVLEQVSSDLYSKPKWADEL